MRYYVEINGVSSLSINGLAIKELPPITKPLMRNMKEEIDGRDGDLITELGYSAYDKQIEIGLYGNFDIDAIIKYFTGEGTITFSNEPDKFYYFKILDQIDYEKLLKFRTATVVFHCQPFKYPTNEEPIEVEPVVKSGEGETITIDDTYEGNLEMLLKGNTYQDSTTGKNMIDYSMIATPELQSNGYYKLAFPGSKKIFEGAFEENTQYTLSFMGYRPGQDGNGGGFNIVYTDSTQDMIRVNTSNPSSYSITSKANKNISYIFVTWGSTNISYLKDLQLEEGSQATSYEPYTGEIPSPNPDFPMPVHVVSGDNEVEVCGKNLLERSKCEENKALTWATGITWNETGSLSSDYIRVNIGDSIHSNYRYQKMFYDKNKNYLGALQSNGNVEMNSNGNMESDFVVPNVNGIAYMRLGFRASSNSGVNLLTANIMVNKGTTLLPYEAYKGTTYPINLPEGMELCKIGNYQDYIYKQDKKWYLEKKIGKVVLDGSESGWTNAGGNAPYRYNSSLFPVFTKNVDLLSNYYECKKWDDSWGLFSYLVVATYNQNAIQFRNVDISSLEDFKIWLSTHNTEVYYVLATPVITEITDTTLISQLEAIEKAESYKGQTNINQTNDDLPFWISATITFTPPSTINNIGNIYAKPILTITGSGNVGVVLNGIEILQINLGDGNTIAIDVPNLEAYNPSDNTLMNRLVTGDYMKLLIQEGENTLSFNGDVSSYSVTGYTRWI